jgi:hypothetical protein
VHYFFHGDPIRGVVGGSRKAEQIRFLPERMVRVIPPSFLVEALPTQADALSKFGNAVRVPAKRDIRYLWDVCGDMMVLLRSS